VSIWKMSGCFWFWVEIGEKERERLTDDGDVKFDGETNCFLVSVFPLLFLFSFSVYATPLLTSIRRLVGEIGAKYLPTARLERPRAVSPFSSSSSSSMPPRPKKPKKPPRPRPAAAPRRILTAAARAVSARALVRLPPTLVTDGMARAWA